MTSYKSYKENSDNLICRICHNEYKYLGSHIWHKHRKKARLYKQMFKLDYSLPLMSEKVRIKKQIAFNKHRKKYLKNLENSKQFRFKKGEKNRIYFSAQSIERYNKQLKSMNNSGLCFVCGMKFQHLYSHLFEKHKLVNISKFSNKFPNILGKS